MLTHGIPRAAIAGLTAASFFWSVSSHAQSNRQTVAIEAGVIEGSVAGDVLSFKGIPYAAPPIGSLRWRSPQPMTPQVTIAGESAGGISVMHLLTWPAAQGLFHRAAVMSGGGRSYMMPHRKLNEATGGMPSAEASGLAFATSVGITDTGAAGLRALRALPAETVNGTLSMVWRHF